MVHHWSPLCMLDFPGTPHRRPIATRHLYYQRSSVPYHHESLAGIKESIRMTALNESAGQAHDISKAIHQISFPVNSII